jgi:hypothetical protein
VDKYTVHFDARNAASPSPTVEAESEAIAVKLAETKLKAGYPCWRDWTWSAKRVIKGK